MNYVPFLLMFLCIEDTSIAVISHDGRCVFDYKGMDNNKKEVTKRMPYDFFCSG